MTDGERLSQAVTPLLYWYGQNARELPWRMEPTPYHVLLSEVMLQQTRVETVRSYYERFLSALPDFPSLAVCGDDILMKLWQGLGYYSRVRNLKKTAQVLCSRYGGTLPADYDSLRTLPGVGAYTAGAVASIAYGLPVPAVDGNVLRVVMRLCADGDDIGKEQTKEKVRKLLTEVYQAVPESSSRLTQAWMEIGALVCIPNGAPHCSECPLWELCEAHAHSQETAYPVKAPKKERRVEDRCILLLSCGGQYLLSRRPSEGLLAGLWEFPCMDGIPSEEEVTRYLVTAGLDPLGIPVPLPVAKHIFTHIEWHMTGYFCEVGKAGSFTTAAVEEIEERYAVPSAYQKYLSCLGRFHKQV